MLFASQSVMECQLEWRKYCEQTHATRISLEYRCTHCNKNRSPRRIPICFWSATAAQKTHLHRNLMRMTCASRRVEIVPPFNWSNDLYVCMLYQTAALLLFLLFATSLAYGNRIYISYSMLSGQSRQWNIIAVSPQESALECAVRTNWTVFYRSSRLIVNEIPPFQVRQAYVALVRMRCYMCAQHVKWKRERQ